MDVAPGVERPPLTRTVGGISRRRALLIGVPLGTVLVLGIALVVWLANVEPLVVDTTAIGVRPQRLVVESFDAQSPDGDDFIQYRIVLPPTARFGFRFYVHNDSPFAVTLTGFDEGPRTWGPRILGVRAGQTHAGATFSPLPVTIAPHGYLELRVRAGFRGCLSEDTGSAIRDLGLTFRMFGVAERHTRILLPMTIEIVGAPGVRCSYG